MKAAPGVWGDILALGVSQIVGYGTLYYSFGILAPAWPEISNGLSNGYSVPFLPRYSRVD